MDTKQVGRMFVATGTFGIFASLIWWMTFYSEVLKAVGSNDTLGAFVRCMLADTAACSIAKNIARFAGYTPYEPIFLWLSGVIIVVGVVMVHSQSQQGV